MRFKLFGLVAVLASVAALSGAASAHERDRERSQGYARFENQRREREREQAFSGRDWRRRATTYYPQAIPYARTTFVPGATYLPAATTYVAPPVPGSSYE